MDLGSLFIILALLILVGLFVSRPLFDTKNGDAGSLQENDLGDPGKVDNYDHQVSALLAERDRILVAIEELDFDAELRKIPQEEYPVQRQMLLNQGAEVLRQLNAAQTQGQEPITISVIGVEEKIPGPGLIAGKQAAVSNKTEADSTNGHKVVIEDDEIEALLASRRRERQGKASGFCHKCGGALQKVDKFCPKCGEKI